MAASVRKLSDEPIAIIHIEVPGDRNLASLRAVEVQVNQIVRETGDPLYCVLDGRSLEPSYSDVLLWLDDHQQAYPSPITNPHIRLVVVGTHPMLATAVQKVRQFFKTDVPLFTTLDEALAFIRGEIDTVL